MPPKFLEHALILTHAPIATRDWWRDALGLVEGDAPDFGFPVHWLYIGDRDCVHIAPAGGSAAQNAYLGNEAGGPPMGSGRLDHISGVHRRANQRPQSRTEFPSGRSRSSRPNTCNRSLSRDGYAGAQDFEAGWIMVQQ